MKCNDCNVKRGVVLCQGDLPLCGKCKVKRFSTTDEADMAANTVNTNTTGGSPNNGDDNMATILREIRSINEKLQKINVLEGKLEQVEKSMKFINDVYEENKKKLEEIQNTNHLLIAENGLLKRKVSSLERNYNDLDQYTRRENIVITGIPETDNEDTDEIALKVAKIADNNVTMSDIDASHRFGKRQVSGEQHHKYPSPIIVRFTTRRVRDSVFKNRKKLADVNSSNIGYRAANVIYINENLTPMAKSLLTKVNIKRKHFKWKFMWTHNGRILIKKDELSPVVHIADEESLTKIC
uniref:Uncharacterized protein LOC102806889 n=1 Tax=Saccoglossus kowalevskii TaxID=10224 RepID=A0ABM0MYH7_SACKO|nr:PREDICTED: uncharacterized protein LOC102806889 [Saccoglossus kowalevskii]